MLHRQRYSIPSAHRHPLPRTVLLTALHVPGTPQTCVRLGDWGEEEEEREEREEKGRRERRDFIEVLYCVQHYYYLTWRGNENENEIDYC